MLKRIPIFLMSFLLASTQCLSAGFYAGLGAGVDTATFSQHSAIFDGAPNVTDSLFITDKSKLAGNGFLGSLIGGYGWHYNHLYLAGEVNANLSSVEAKKSNFERTHKTFSQTTLRINRSYGIGILPGFLCLDNTLFYGRLGLERGGFEISTSDPSLSSVNKMLSGFRYGMGIEKTFEKHYALRLDYSHIDYKTYGEATIDHVSFVRKETGFTPQSNQFELAFIYKFT